MRERSIAQMKTWLAQQAAACLDAQQQLRREGREDEAVFQRIRENVFELSAAVLDTAGKQLEPEVFFLQRMESIPANWKVARDKALAHGNSVQAHLEEIKLEAAEEIIRRFRQTGSDKT